MKKITGTHIGIILIIAFFMLQINILHADDNIISLEQSGDNLALGVDQIGYNNQIVMKDDNSYITSANLNIYLVQDNRSSGALTNKIIFDEVSGTGNKMKLAQGAAWNTLDSDTDLTWWSDDEEGGGHEIGITMYGDYNKLAVQQTNQATATDGHDFNLHLSGDYNEVQIKQQHDGAKNIDLTIYNDYNDVFIRQKGADANHTATITLDGLYGTDLILKQLSTTTQTYTLSVDCMTVGGCSTIVIQE